MNKWRKQMKVVILAIGVNNNTIQGRKEIILSRERIRLQDMLQ